MRQSYGRLPLPSTKFALTVPLRGLIDGVVMHPQVDGFTVELVGEIANMVALALGPETQKAASGEAAVPDVYRRSVKVVAGARNHLYLLFCTRHLDAIGD